MQELEFHIRGKNYSSIFATKSEGDDDKPEVRLAIHIVGGSCVTKISLDTARELAEALMQIVESK